MEAMYKQPPLVACPFCWGKKFELYQHHLDINGTYYALDTLTHIRPIYQHFMGISSVRLELSFGKKKITLRGIPATEDTRKVIAQLASLQTRNVVVTPVESTAHQL